MAAVGDSSLESSNANILQTLDQIIEMETRETAALQAAAVAAESTPLTRGKRKRQGQGPSSSDYDDSRRRVTFSWRRWIWPFKKG